MSVGSKIKALRLQCGMTQSDLADGIVTRGMLSRIESGSANPSMATLAALAARLEVSTGFLLEEGEDLLPAERARFAKSITEEYKAGNLRACLDLFSASSFSAEAEFAGIYVHTAFSVAVEEFCRGDFSKARQLLTSVETELPKLLIPLPTVSESRIAFLRNVMEHIGDLDTAISLVGDTPDFGFQPALFFFILKLLRDGRHEDCKLLIEFGAPEPMYLAYITAQSQIREYKFIDAILTMKALTAKADCPYFLLLLCFCSMENCCKLCEDYKGAYENHLKYRALLEKADDRM